VLLRLAYIRCASPAVRALLAALLHRLRPQALRRMRLLVRPDTVLRSPRPGQEAARCPVQAQAAGPAPHGAFGPRPGPAPGSREAGYVQLPGVHAHLRGLMRRALVDTAGNRCQTAAGEAEAGESRDHATSAPVRPRTGEMAGQRGKRAPGVLRRARQRQRGERIPHPGDTALAPCAFEPRARKAASPGRG
jgi:hypothetical protein